MNHVESITLIVKLNLKLQISKNCAPFTSCISRINNTQIDDAQYIDVVIPTYNLKEYSDNYSKNIWSIFQYCRGVTVVDNKRDVTDFTEAIVTDSFNLKEKLTGRIGDNGTKNVEIMVPLKNMSDLWRTLETVLVNCEVTLDLSWSESYVLVATNAAQATKFSTADKKLYLPAVTLSTQDNAKVLERLKSGFKRKIDWNKYQTKVSTERVNW